MSTPLTSPRRLVLAASALLFLAALPAPALLFTDRPPVRGITTLAFGWWGVILGDFPWFANPLYFGALVLLWRGFNLAAAALSVLAIVIGLRTLGVDEWYHNEAGGTPVVGFGLAFWFWIASFAVLLIGGLGLARAKPSPAAPSA